MNIKTLRNKYENLSMYQRLALLDNAISRNDDSEAEAIAAASPRKTFSQTDYGEIYDEISRVRFCNLVARLGYIMTFDFSFNPGFEKLKNKSVTKEKKAISHSLRLTAYLYVRATDSWNAVNDELGLRPRWDDEIGELLFSTKLLQAKDCMMREYAFNEEEAKAYMLKQTGNSAIKTVEDEIDGYREYLKLKNS